MKSNQPLLDELTNEQRNAVLEGADAINTLADFRRRRFDEWMRVAKGVDVLCKIADRPGMLRKARKNLLNDNGFGSVNEGTVSRLLLMVEYEPEIRIWRDTLTEKNRESWNSPTSICNRCPAVREAVAEARAIVDKPPPKPRAKKNQHLAVESAVDTIANYMKSADADGRAVILEQMGAASGGDFQEALDEISAVFINEIIPRMSADTVREILRQRAPIFLRLCPHLVEEAETEVSK
jgi:hypothetical protein